MTQKLRYSIVFFFSVFIASAQSLTGRVTDSRTGESLPFANIIINESEYLISNEEGYFSIPEKYNDDAKVYVSCMGYIGRSLKLSQLRNQTTVRLEPGTYELKVVDVDNKPKDPYQIMAQVKKNLPQNYKTEQRSKNLQFMRKSQTIRPKVFDFEIEKSTGFTKRNLQDANKQFEKFAKELIKHPPRTYTDMLFNLYAGNDGAQSQSKLEMIKATRLTDEERVSSMEDIEEKAGKLLLKHIDTTKFYRFKSGWFGSRDTVSLNKEYNDKKKSKGSEKKDSQLTSAKTGLANFFWENNFKNKEFEFIHKSDIYEYKYEGATYMNNEDFVYIISFKPKKSRAKFKGKLYISESDFAILRADYALEEGKKLEGLNLRLILGLKFAQNHAKGTLIFRKKKSADDYYLQYASVEEGVYFYVHRPLKFIELTEKKDKDVVALDLKIEANSITKTEFLNISREDISAAQYADAREKEFQYLMLKRYDPEIWKEYSAIEPLTEMKSYQVGM